MRKSRRLQIVLTLAALKKQQAAEHLASVQREMQSLKEQEQQLHGYQQDYNEQFKQMTVNANAAQLVNYQRFFSQLDTAIDSQQQRVCLSESQQENARVQWQQQYAREKNLGSLIEKIQKQEEQTEDKNTQRELDDRYSGRKSHL